MCPLGREEREEAKPQIAALQSLVSPGLWGQAPREAFQPAHLCVLQMAPTICPAPHLQVPVTSLKAFSLTQSWVPVALSAPALSPEGLPRLWRIQAPAGLSPPHLMPSLGPHTRSLVSLLNPPPVAPDVLPRCLSPTDGLYLGALKAMASASTPAPHSCFLTTTEGPSGMHSCPSPPHAPHTRPSPPYTPTPDLASTRPTHPPLASTRPTYL